MALDLFFQLFFTLAPPQWEFHALLPFQFFIIQRTDEEPSYCFSINKVSTVLLPSAFGFSITHNIDLPSSERVNLRVNPCDFPFCLHVWTRVFPSHFAVIVYGVLGSLISASFPSAAYSYSMLCSLSPKAMVSVSLNEESF